MSKKTRHTTNLESADALARLFDGFDFQVEPDDFVLYELARLIEEDRASFEDEEFRRIIDLGIHAHVESRLDVRADLASILRRSKERNAVKTIHALENNDSTLRNLSLIVRTYTSYIFGRLQAVADQSTTLESEAHALIQTWQKGEHSPESLSHRLLEIGRPAVGPLADLIFETPDDGKSADLALSLLGSIRCPSSARVLTHTVLEPILSEELELKAFRNARSLWPLQRDYVLYTLSDHQHEDLPFRWFQLLIECDELTAVDLILEEMVVHGGNPAYSEDLKVIIELLRLSRDPDVEEKVVAVMNFDDTPREAVGYLQSFVSNFRPSRQPSDNPWSRATRLAGLNQSYIAAAKLFDSGKVTEASHALDDLLSEMPDYPFAAGLKDLITSRR